MGYDLVNEQGHYFRVGFGGWSRMLALAERGGWEQIGTVLLDDEGEMVEEWDGHYDSNSGQDVLAEDAAALADALERVMPDIPDIKTGPKHTIYAGRGNDNAGLQQMLRMMQNAGDIPETPVIAYANTFKFGDPQPDVLIVPYGVEYSESPVDYWSGTEQKDYLRQFVAYCRQGMFTIR